MLDQVLDALDPLIANALYTVLMGLLGSLGWVGMAIRALLQTKQAQQSLHMALDTGVDWVTDVIADIATGNRHHSARSEAEDKIVEYVQGSVPGAIKKLRASPAQLKRMAQARVTAALEHSRVGSFVEYLN